MIQPRRNFHGTNSSSPARANDAKRPRLDRRHWLGLAGGALLSSFGGCGWFRNMRHQDVLSTIPTALENPMFVAQTDSELIWNQLVDELDDYFKIRREERVRIIENVITEGWIETFPTSGSTWLEPWRKDSSPGYERWLATFQSIRRWARVRLIPAPGGYRIEVAVYKELEDLEQPMNASVGGATLRHDNSREREDDPLRIGPDQMGWIPLGRDEQLEQRILGNLLSRLSACAPPS
ncbi:MAG: hypothetical protein KDA83_02690 [Planctomycetales bacterium]|nr:hypothetical protein [Planctomycetales bacterium]